VARARVCGARDGGCDSMGPRGHGGSAYTGAAKALACVPRRHEESARPGQTRARVRLGRWARATFSRGVGPAAILVCYPTFLAPV
jgi:hypothetical protein